MTRPSLVIRSAALAFTTAGLLMSLAAPAAARSHAAAATPTPSATPPATSESIGQTVQKLEAASAADPNDVSVGVQLAQAYIMANRPDLALRVTQRYLSSGHRVAALYYFNGLANRLLDQPPQALLSMQQAEQLDPLNPATLTAITELDVQLNRLDDALREGKRNITVNAKDEHAHISYGVALAVSRQLDPARQQFQLAAGIEPKDALPEILVGRTYIDGKDSDKAVAAFDLALQLDPKNIDAMQGKAQALGAEGRVSDAVALYEQIFSATSAPEQKVRILIEEAQLYVGSKQNDQAETVLTRAVNQFPDVIIGHVAYGDFLALANRMGDARTQWTLAAGKDQTGLVGLFRLGTDALQNNHLPDAIAKFSRMTALNPEDAVAWLRLGDAHFLNHEPDDALHAYQRSYALQSSPEALAGIGTTYFAEHNFVTAAKYFDQLDPMNSNFVSSNPELMFGIARSYDLANEKSKARAMYNRLLSMVKPGTSSEKELKALLAHLDDSKNNATQAQKHTAAPNVKSR